MEDFKNLKVGVRPTNWR